MSEECTHNCETCGAACSSKEKQSMLETPHELSSIKNIIAVVSGKGGVGKSLVTSLLAVCMQREGLHAGILDADITGPSIPKIFGLKEKAEGSESGLFPVKTKSGIDVMSINLLLENETDPVVWRGPIIAGVVKQFYTETIWKEIDFLFVDMPPGTGDVPLTVFQSLPVKGVIIVTSPQELVSMVVEKAVKMAGMLNIPVIGIVENMSYFECPSCHERHAIFGSSHIDEIAADYGVCNVAKIPINPKLAGACDSGLIELFDGNWLDGLVQYMEEMK